jgi:hypothetical protein
LLVVQEVGQKEETRYLSMPFDQEVSVAKCVYCSSKGLLSKALFVKQQFLALK